MNLEKEYLTDEELERLILDVEQNELVAAPPDLAADIMAGISRALGTGAAHESGLEHENGAENESGAAYGRDTEHKVKEFRNYCFRVLTSVAAAVVIVFLLPGLLNLQRSDVPTRQEMVTPGKYATKEEAMNDEGILSETLGNITVFDDINIFKRFRERNGG